MTVKVLAITGDGRSGSTILDNVLGEIDGFVSVGELRFVWQRSLGEGRSCGCGRGIRECELWPRVFETAYGGFDAVDVERVTRLMDLVRTRFALAAALGPSRRWWDRRLDELVPVLDPLYRSIAGVTGARVIVDSSKVPTYTYLLGRLPSVDLHVVHLVRDPRAVAHSNRRAKPQLDTSERRDMTRTGPARAAFYWTLWNGLTRRLFADSPNYTLLRYEDLVADPASHVSRLVASLGETGVDLPFVDGNAVELHPNHTVSGNPSRFATGTVALRLDEAWKRDMPRRDRRLVTALTSPFLATYGYRRRTG